MKSLGLLEKTIMAGNHREILGLALATLRNWSLGTASICQILELTTSELEDLMIHSSDSDNLRLRTDQVERSRLVLEMSIVINAALQNPANRRKFVHLASPVFGGRTPLEILEKDDTTALREAVYKLGSHFRGPW